MKRLHNVAANLLCGGALLLGHFRSGRVTLPSDWQREQSFNVSTGGLVKISLPAKTLDDARPALREICGFYDDAGNEVPSHLIERPVTGPPRSCRRQNPFRVCSTPTRPSSRSKRGLAQPLDGVTLETSRDGFYQSCAR